MTIINIVNLRKKNINYKLLRFVRRFRRIRLISINQKFNSEKIKFSMELLIFYKFNFLTFSRFTIKFKKKSLYINYMIDLKSQYQWY